MYASSVCFSLCKPYLTKLFLQEHPNTLSTLPSTEKAQAVHKTNINLPNMQSTFGYQIARLVTLISLQEKSPRQAVIVEQLDSASHSLPHTAATLQRRG
jgi:hypothetical protein